MMELVVSKWSSRFLTANSTDIQTLQIIVKVLDSQLYTKRLDGDVLTISFTKKCRHEFCRSDNFSNYENTRKYSSGRNTFSSKSHQLIYGKMNAHDIHSKFQQPNINALFKKNSTNEKVYIFKFLYF